MIKTAPHSIISPQMWFARTQIYWQEFVKLSNAKNSACFVKKGLRSVNISDLIRNFHMDLFSLYVLFSYFRACLHAGGGEHQVGEVTRLDGVPRPGCPLDFSYGHPTYHVNAIKSIREIVLSGGLPHLSGFHRLPWGPHLHVNRPLDHRWYPRDLFPSSAVPCTCDHSHIHA